MYIYFCVAEIKAKVKGAFYSVLFFLKEKIGFLKKENRKRREQSSLLDSESAKLMTRVDRKVNSWEAILRPKAYRVKGDS